MTFLLESNQLVNQYLNSIQLRCLCEYIFMYVWCYESKIHFKYSNIFISLFAMNLKLHFWLESSPLLRPYALIWGIPSVGLLVWPVRLHRWVIWGYVYWKTSERRKVMPAICLHPYYNSSPLPKMGVGQHQKAPNLWMVHLDAIYHRRDMAITSSLRFIFTF